jgi:chorismate dehydratase
MTQVPPTLRFSSTSYANQLPLAHFIPDVSPDASLVTVPLPSDVLAQLESGAADAVLLPVAELVRHPELVMIDGLGVCAMRKVRSVLLKCRVPLRDVQTVEEDPASRTSNALVRVLFRALWKQAVRFVAPGATPAPDAGVMIGDRALCAPPAPAGDIDLAAAWYDLTSQPFVFAAWVHRQGHPRAEELAHIAHAAKRRGVAELPALARLVARRLGLDEAACLDYLTHDIYFDVGSQECEALRHFLRLAAESPAVVVKESRA